MKSYKPTFFWGAPSFGIIHHGPNHNASCENSTLGPARFAASPDRPLHPMARSVKKSRDRPSGKTAERWKDGERITIQVIWIDHEAQECRDCFGWCGWCGWCGLVTDILLHCTKQGGSKCSLDPMVKSPLNAGTWMSIPKIYGIDRVWAPFKNLTTNQRQCLDSGFLWKSDINGSVRAWFGKLEPSMLLHPNCLW